MIKTITEDRETWPEGDRRFYFIDKTDDPIIIDTAVFAEGILNRPEFFEIWEGTVWVYEEGILPLLQSKAVLVEREDLKQLCLLFTPRSTPGKEIKAKLTGLLGGNNG